MTSGERVAHLAVVGRNAGSLTGAVAAELFWWSCGNTRAYLLPPLAGLVLGGALGYALWWRGEGKVLVSRLKEGEMPVVRAGAFSGAFAVSVLWLAGGLFLGHATDGLVMWTVGGVLFGFLLGSIFGLFSWAILKL
jgi:hypothetical protein